MPGVPRDWAASQDTGLLREGAVSRAWAPSPSGDVLRSQGAPHRNDATQRRDVPFPRSVQDLHRPILAFEGATLFSPIPKELGVSLKSL